MANFSRPIPKPRGNMGAGPSRRDLARAYEELGRLGGAATSGGGLRQGLGGTLIDPPIELRNRYIRLVSGEPTDDGYYDAVELRCTLGDTDPVWEDYESVWALWAGADPTNLPTLPVKSESDYFYRIPAIEAGLVKSKDTDETRKLFRFEPYSFTELVKITNVTPAGDGSYDAVYYHDGGASAVRAIFLAAAPADLAVNDVFGGWLAGVTVSGVAKFEIPRAAASPGFRLDQDDGGGDICLNTTRVDVAGTGGVTVAVAQVGAPANRRAKLTIGYTPSGGGSGTGTGGGYFIWTHNRAAAMSGVAETIDVSGADVRGKLLDFRAIIAANTASVGSVDNYWIPPTGGSLLATGTSVVDEVLDSGGANSFSIGCLFVDKTGRLIANDGDRDVAVTTGHHVPFPGGGTNISGGGAGLYVDSSNGHLYLRVVAGAAASATQIIVVWRFVN